MKFEDLVKTPSDVADRLASFPGTSVVGDVVLKKGNPSFSGGPAKELTATEILLREKIAGSSMQAAGYELSSPQPHVRDVVDLIGTSVDFTAYKLGNIIKNKRNRASTFAFLKSLLGTGEVPK